METIPPRAYHDVIDPSTTVRHPHLSIRSNHPPRIPNLLSTLRPKSKLLGTSMGTAWAVVSLWYGRRSDSAQDVKSNKANFFEPRCGSQNLQFQVKYR